MSRANAPRVRIGRDAVVIAGDSGPVILSGGGSASVRLSPSEEGAAIEIAHAGGETVRLTSGPSDRIAGEYAALTAAMLGRGPGRASMAAAAVAIAIAGFGAGWLASTAYVPSPARMSIPAMAAEASGIPGILQVPGLLPALEEAARRTETDAPRAPAGSIQARPPFLADPAPLAAPQEPPAAPEASAPAPAVIPDLPGLPAYVPPAKAEPDAPKPAAEGPKPAPAAEAEKGKAGETAAKADEAADAAAVPPAAPAAAEPTAPVRENIEADAKSAAQRMLESGMTPDQALDVIEKLEELGQADSDMITPEMLAALPHEVARILVDSGMVGEGSADADAPGGTPYRIIRLPDEVVEKYRGSDGIASIPEKNSWISTGNAVSIPLPGGGDIAKPEDLKEFSLSP